MLRAPHPERSGSASKTIAPCRRVALALGGLACLAGCSGAPVKPAERAPPPAPASAPASGSKVSSGLTESEVRSLDPRAYAARFRRPSFCEQAARALHPASASKAWEMLAACIDKGDFKLLDRLLEEPWLSELRARPDAPRLIAQVIAARGGDDVRDGAVLRDHDISIFGLESAVRQPGAFRGRILLLRASVAEIHAQPGETTVRLLARGFTRSSDVHVLGRLPRPDPLLVRGKDLVVAARFEALEEKPGVGERRGEWIALLSVIGYSEPAAAVIE